MAWKGDDDTTVGQRVGSRGDGLRRRSIAGQEAYSGAVGDQMLAGTGARAAVVDDTDIIVSSDFNSSNLNDQSLFMHELSHRDLGWGEEASQAMELATMVFQQMEGANFDLQRGVGMINQMKGVAEGQLSGEAIVRMVGGEKRAKEDEASSMTGYFGMKAQGFGHKEIVEKLGKWANDEIGRQDEERKFRTGEG